MRGPDLVRAELANYGRRGGAGRHGRGATAVDHELLEDAQRRGTTVVEYYDRTGSSSWVLRPGGDLHFAISRITTHRLDALDAGDARVMHADLGLGTRKRRYRRLVERRNRRARGAGAGGQDPRPCSGSCTRLRSSRSSRGSQGPAGIILRNNELEVLTPFLQAGSSMIEPWFVEEVAGFCKRRKSMIINKFRVPMCIRNEILNILIGNRDEFLSNK